MLSNSLIYFMEYTSIVQVSTELNDESTHLCYSDDALFYMITNQLHVDTCILLAINELQDKHLLKQYIYQFYYDNNWIKLLCSFNVIKDYTLLANRSAIDGNLDMIKFLIEQDDGIDCCKLFHLSCEYGHLDIVKYILEEYLTDDEQRNEYITSNNSYALEWSVLNNRTDVIKYLIGEMRAQLDHHKIFMKACENTDLDLVKFLVEKCFPKDAEGRKEYVNRGNDNYPCRALTWSVCNNDSIFKYLIEIGADIRINNYEVIDASLSFGTDYTIMYFLDQLDEEERRRYIVQNNFKVMKSCDNDSYLDAFKYIVKNGAAQRN